MSEIDNYLNSLESNDKPSAKKDKSSSLDSEIASILESAPTQDKGFGGAAKDFGLSLAKGVIGVPEALVGLADIPAGGKVGKFLENEDGLLGFRPKQAKEFLSEFHTDKFKEQQQEFADADGIADKTIHAIKNPSLITGTLAESAPSIGLGGVYARGLGLASKGLSGVARGGIGEGAVMAGQQASEIRGETEDGLLTGKQAGLSLATGTLGTLFGIGGASLARKLGIGDVDTMLAKGLKPEQVAAEIASMPAKSIPRKVIEGMITEGFLEELPQSVSEQILQNLALDKDWSEGVEDAAVMGTLAGMAMGGGAAFAGRQGATQADDATKIDGNAPIDQQQVEAEAPQYDAWGDPIPKANIDIGQMEEGGVTPAPVFDPQDIDSKLGATPSQQMGINPDDGPLSAAAAQSVDSGLFTGGFTPQASINQAALEREGVTPPPVLDTDQIDRNLGSIDPITGEYIPAPERIGQQAPEKTTGNYEYDQWGNLNKVDGRAVDGYDAGQPRLGFNSKAERSTAPMYEVSPDGVARPTSGESARSMKERVDLSGLDRGKQQTQPQQAQQQQAKPARTPEQDAQSIWNSLNSFERNAAVADTLGMRGVPAKAVAARNWEALSKKQKEKLVGNLTAKQGSRWTDPNQKATDQSGPVLQNRDRTSQDSIMQMRGISNNPDYNRLKTSGFLSDGAPVVINEKIQVPESQLGVTDTASAGDQKFNVQYAVVEADQLATSNNIDGTVNPDYATGPDGKARAIAGNGRVTGLQSAWAKGKADQYKTDMASDKMHGIDPAVIKGMKNPILVRLLPQDEVTDNIGDLSNRDEKGKLSPVEQAKTDMGRIDLDSLKFTAEGAIGGEAIHQFRMAQPAAERVSEAEARKRLTSAVFQKAYGNDQLTEIQSGESDDAKSIMSALAQAAPSMSRLEGAGEFDVRPLITQAGIAAVNAARRGTKLADYVQQSEMGIDPMVYPILEMMLNEHGNIRSSKYIGEQLTNMAKLAYDEANSPGSDMFGEKPKRTAEQVIQDALTGVQGYGQINDGRGQESLGQRGRSEPDAQMAEGPEGGRERPADTGQAARAQPEAEQGQPAAVAPWGDRSFTLYVDEEYGPPPPHTKAYEAAKSAPKGSVTHGLTVRPSGKQWHNLYLSHGNGDFSSVSVGKDMPSNVADLIEQGFSDYDKKQKKQEQAAKDKDVVSAKETAIAKENNLALGRELGTIIPNTGKQFKSAKIIADHGDGTFTLRGVQGNKQAELRGLSASSIVRAVDRYNLNAGTESEAWRTNYLRAAKVARDLGIDPKQHKKLADLVAAIDAFNAEPVASQTNQQVAAAKPAADSKTGVLIDNATDMTSALAAIARGAQLSTEPNGDVILSGTKIITLPKQPTSVDEVIGALAVALRDQMRADGVSMPGNPADMTRDQFVVAYEFANIIPEFEITGEDIGGVVQGSNSGLTVDADKLYDKIIEQAKEQTKPALKLNQQTEESLAKDAERLEQLQKEEAAKKAKQKAAESKQRERDADKARADEVVDDFQLGQPAEDAMSGMGDIFATESNPSAAVDQSIKDNIEQISEPAKRPSNYGSDNKLVSSERADELRKRLQAKLFGQLNSGFDPEILAIGAELAAFHIEAGARKFAAFAKAIAQDLGTTPYGLRKYLRSWYNGARDMMEDSDISIDGMDSPDAVRESLKEITDSAETKEPAHDAQQRIAQRVLKEVAKDGWQDDAIKKREMLAALYQDGYSFDTVMSELGVDSSEANTLNNASKIIDYIYQDADNVKSTAASTKQNSAKYDASTDERSILDDSRGEVRRPASKDGKTAGQAEQKASDAVDNSSNTATGKPSNKPVSSEKSRLENEAAGSIDDSRSMPDSTGGLYADRKTGGVVSEGPGAAPAEVKKLNLKATSKASNPDLDEVKSQMPFLTDGQAQDVVFAEKRLSKDNGYGVLFTNGTGTGKTFTGLGIVKRMIMRGKKNILILAPKQTITRAWIDAGKDFFNIDISALKDTNDAGEGVVVTTYANLGDNNALMRRDWDAVVADEAHYLSSAQTGKDTSALKKLRAMTLKNNTARDRVLALNPELNEEMKALYADAETNRKSDNQILWDRAVEQKEKADEISKQLKQMVGKEKARIEAIPSKDAPRVVFLSATPFAYEKSVSWANEFLFDWGTTESSGAYNSADGYESFMMQHFGYRMRYNKLTAPDAKVDSGLMQRSFNTWLKKEGVLSGRALDSDFDYDRKFVHTENAIGRRVDEAIEWLRENSEISGVSELYTEMITDNFDYHQRMYFLEAIKASESIPIIKDHLALGRKVVVIHDFKKGGASNPFKLKPQTLNSEAMQDAYQLFKDNFPDLIGAFDSMPSPIDQLLEQFPEALVYNGDVSAKKRVEMQDQFNDDSDSAPRLIIAQGDAMREGVSIHDRTGKHPRVMISLGMPVRSIAAMQLEGRTYRTGQASNAMFRYLTIGSNWERFAFASTIASRASAAENLAMGEEARGLKDAFINAYENADAYPAGFEGEGVGGKAEDASYASEMTAWDKAKALYYGTKQQGRGRSASGREHSEFFATPEPLGLKMVQWADIKGGEKTLEPSAGHGAIARWLPDNTENRAIEFTNELSSRLALHFNGDLQTGDFLQHHIINKYDAIVMNPPFGRGGIDAAAHVGKAIRHLNDGGRIVALIPNGPAADKRFEALLESDEAKDVYLAAEIILPSSVFERAGTNVSTRIIVLEKQLNPDNVAKLQQSNKDYSSSKNVDDFFNAIENSEIKSRVEVVKPKAPEAEKSDSAVETWEAKHTKTDADLYMVKPNKRMERDEYKTVAGIAKEHGGFWSRFGKPGFLFKTEADRQAFIDSAFSTDDSPQFSKAPKTDTKAFSDFFGASQVTDSSGKPLVVYHGAPDVRGIFSDGFRAGMRGQVFFAAADYSVANSYADDSRAFDYQNAEPQTIPLYLSIENPMIVDAKGKHWRETEKYIKEAKDAGHDGIIIKNSVDFYNNPAVGGKATTVYAWFKPVQAKSAVEGQLRSRIDGIPIEGAVENSGAFSLEDDRISYSQNKPQQAAQGITKASLIESIANSHPKQEKAVRKMLERGEKGLKGGAVIIDSANQNEIAKVYSAKTGRSLLKSVQMFSDAGQINGFYDKQSGLTFLVGPNLTAETAPAVLFHEVVHSQQRKQVDDAALNMLMTRASLDADTRAFLDRVASRMIDAGESANALESTSYIVEQAILEGRSAGYTTPDSRLMNWIDANLGKGIGNIVRDFTKMVRQFALRRGLPINVTLDDLVQYAMVSVDQAAAGKVAGGNVGTSGNAIERNTGDASPTEAIRVQQAIEGGSLVDAAKFLTQSSDKARAAVARKVLDKLEAMEKSGVNLELNVVHVGDSAPEAMASARAYTEMAMDSKGRDVVVWVNGADVAGKVGVEEEALLHELVHAATSGALLHGSKVEGSPHAEAAKAVYDAAGTISEHISNRFQQAAQGQVTLTPFEQDMRDGYNNAFRNMDEVVAWAMTNREAQQYLDGIPSGKNRTLWTRFVEAVRSYLGLPVTLNSVLSEVLAASEQLMGVGDTTLPSIRAFWHKRNARMITQQAAGKHATAQSGTGNAGTFSADTDDIRFSFAGQRSETADHYSLGSAQQRIESGENAEAVRQDTGWHKGIDGKWRYEISDHDAKLRKPFPSKGQLWGGVYESVNQSKVQRGEGYGISLGEILDHPALFAAYPHLADLSVSTQKGSGASYESGSPSSPASISIGTDVPMSDVPSKLLHEIQHGIQNIEGFARGGTLETGAGLSNLHALLEKQKNEFENEHGFNDWIFELILEQPKRHKALMDEGAKDGYSLRSLYQSFASEKLSEEDRGYFVSRMLGYEDKLRKVALSKHITPSEFYQRLAGEVEARNTQIRHKMTAEQRKSTPPSATQDVSDADAIVMFNGTEMHNAPAPANTGTSDIRFSRSGVTNSPAFKRWFGDSKVVDANGEPLRVYHGTNSEFYIFDKNKRGSVFDDEASKSGFFFAEDIHDAEFFAGKAYRKNGGKGVTQEVYLSIQNPITITDEMISEYTDEWLNDLEYSDPQEWEFQMSTKQYANSQDIHKGLELAIADVSQSSHDGIIVDTEGTDRWFIVFDSTQIKSATGNVGAYGQRPVAADEAARFGMTQDEANEAQGRGDIRFSRAANPASVNAAPNGMAAWDSPSASKFDDFVYKIQDKHVDTKRVIEAIRDTGKAISDDLDVYLQETLFHGRAAKRTQDFLNKEVNPLIEYMQSAKVEMSDLEEFLHARHAQEANALIAKRDPNMPDGGSGMTNAEAAKYLKSLNGVRRKQFENAAMMVDKIIGGTRETIVNYGLESQETVDGWTAGFKHYIPLQREDKDGQMGIGQGFSVKGKETKGRTGSTRKVVDILANVMMQRERAIVRGEKNRVAVALLGLAKDNPLPEFWQVDKVPTTRVLDKVTGLVRNQADPMYKSRDNAIVAKVNGQEHAILMNEDDPRAMRMAEALKNLDAAQLEGLLGATATATRYFAAVNTQYNPIFGVTNFVRDIQEAMLHLQSTPLKGQQARLFKNTFTAVKAVMKAERDGRKGNNATGKWGVLWEDFQNTGGQTGFRDQFSSSADRGEAIKSALTPGGWADTGLGKLFTAGGVLKVPLEVARKKAAWLFDLLSDYNTAMENGVRLSAYETGINAGMSKEQAAALAKGLTVNFNRKGQVTQQVGALYAFFNASVQGTARLGQSLFDMDAGKPKTLRLSSLGKKIVSGGVMLGASQAVLLAMAGFDDEEPPEFIRERNIIIPTGGKTYISIPMPLGYHVIANLGRIPTEFALGGGEDAAKHLMSLMDVMADIYNPIGNSGLSMQTIAPTVLDPLAGLAENKDFSGRAIAKESFNRQTPGHALARDTASLPATWLAEMINYATGGTEFTRGELSPTPDQIDYLVGQLTGGVGREATKFMQSSQAVATGDELPWHKIPLVGRFIGDADSDGAKQSAFYNSMDKVRKHAEEVKGLRASGRSSEAIEYANKHPQARLHLAARAAEKQVKDMRDRKRDLEQAGAPREEIRALEKRMVQRMEQFVELSAVRK